jgi:hypothetical protein
MKICPILAAGEYSQFCLAEDCAFWRTWSEFSHIDDDENMIYKEMSGCSLMVIANSLRQLIERVAI